MQALALGVPAEAQRQGAMGLALTAALTATLTAAKTAAALTRGLAGVPAAVAKARPPWQDGRAQTPRDEREIEPPRYCMFIQSFEQA